MNQHEKVRKVLIETGALKVYAGLHYTLEHHALCAHPRQLFFLAQILAGYFYRQEVQTVIGTFMSPSGILAAAVGCGLDRPERPVQAGFVSEEPSVSPCLFLPNFFHSLVKNKNVLIIEDFVDDPDRTQTIINEVLCHDGRVIGLGAIAEATGKFDELFKDVPCRYALLRSHQLLG